MDFWEMETISFPPEGSSMTPAHHYSEFRFKIYAPIAFRYFRDLFGIQPDDFMVRSEKLKKKIQQKLVSMCSLVGDVNAFSS